MRRTGRFKEAATFHSVTEELWRGTLTLVSTLSFKLRWDLGQVTSVLGTSSMQWTQKVQGLKQKPFQAQTERDFIGRSECLYHQNSKKKGLEGHQTRKLLLSTVTIIVPHSPEALQDRGPWSVLNLQPCRSSAEGGCFPGFSLQGWH